MLTSTQNAIFRPLVKRSWARHCTTMGLDTADQLSYRSWYENILMSTCEIRSTKDANWQEYNALIDRFKMLAGNSPVLVKITGWTLKQNCCFSELAKLAWMADVRRGSDQDVENWIDAQLIECGIGHHAPDNTESFDRVMAHFAVIANHLGWINRMASAVERRYRYLITQQMAELSQLTGISYSWEYVRGIYKQMDLCPSLDEAPSEQLRKVFQALNTYKRRTEKQNNVPF